MSVPHLTAGLGSDHWQSKAGPRFDSCPVVEAEAAGTRQAQLLRHLVDVRRFSYLCTSLMYGKPKSTGNHSATIKTLLITDVRNREEFSILYISNE